MSDTISRQAAIEALWKALYEYEDRTEKQFQDSDELDVEDWIQHRIFVQNMSDIDRQTIMDLPSAQPDIIRCKDCKWKNNHNCTRAVEVWIDDNKYCAWAERRTDEMQDYISRRTRNE